jgi:nitric oxide dioxygenase
MNRQQAALIRASFEQVSSMPQAVAMLFYGRLFELDPSVRPLFKNDIRSQSQKLVATLAVAVDYAADLSAIVPTLRDLGRTHAGYGVKPGNYLLVRDAMLWTLGQALQEDFDPETRDAWKALLEEVSAQMLAGAAPGEPQG